MGVALREKCVKENCTVYKFIQGQRLPLSSQAPFQEKKTETPATQS